MPAAGSLTPEQPGDGDAGDEAGRIGAEPGGERMAIPDDACRAAIDREHIERGFGRALQHRGEPPRVRVGTETGRREDAPEDAQGAAAGQRTDDRHGEHFGREPERYGDRPQHAGEGVHRARGPERADRREDGDQERDDPDRDLESLLRALDKRFVDLHALQPPVQRNTDEDEREGPVGAELEDVAERGAGGGDQRHSFSSVLATTMATMSEQNVAATVGRRISAGSWEWAEARSAMTVVGTSWRLAVLMATKSACELVAVPGFGLSFSSSSIALIPKGVAALPRPSML